MGKVSIGLKINPKLPHNLDANSLYNKVLHVISKHGLNKPLAVALTGSRVWGLHEDASDYDVLVFGDYTCLKDIYDEYMGRELEITVIPVKKVLNRDLPFETRWDVVSSVPLLKEYEDEILNLKSLTLLNNDEAECLLSHIILRLSWLGIAHKEFKFKGVTIYSSKSRYLDDRLKNNTLNVLFYAIDKLSIMQYTINKLPYPFVKWRLAHLDKLALISEKFLELVKKLNSFNKSLVEFLEDIGSSFEQTLEIINSTTLLSSGIRDEEKCIKIIKYYPYY